MITTNFIVKPGFSRFFLIRNYKNPRENIISINTNFRQEAGGSLNLKCNTNEVEYILSGMPESFVSDKKRSKFLSLPVLQRIGRLDLLEDREEIEFHQKNLYSESNYEFRFLSMKKNISGSKKSSLIKLGLNREDDLLNIQGISSKDIYPAYFSKISKGKKIGNRDIKVVKSQLTFSKISIKKLDYLQRLAISFALILISYFSLF